MRFAFTLLAYVNANASTESSPDPLDRGRPAPVCLPAPLTETREKRQSDPPAAQPPEALGKLTLTPYSQLEASRPSATSRRRHNDNPKPTASIAASAMLTYDPLDGPLTRSIG